MIDIAFLEIIGAIAFCFHLAGMAAALHAVMTARTSQGSIAWALSLISFPYLAVPAYLIFGRGKFQGYVRARRAGNSEIDHIARALEKKLRVFRNRQQEIDPNYHALEQMAKVPFTSHNHATLLIDGAATFEAIFRGIDSAKHYILIQFYILRDDALGQDLKSRLLRKASEGVRVYVLYDEIGSHQLSREYCYELAEAGVVILPFRTSRGLYNRFQVNFRNHRKIVIVDGNKAYVGGLNVGVEYLGHNPKFGPWRDTHVEVSGPVVQAIQFAFLEDWYWAAGDVPELDWTPNPANDGNRHALVLASGPVDTLDTCGMFFVHAINAAKRRVWISSPYFVPDDPVLTALHLAALRGVDVRIMLPEEADHILVYWAAFAYVAETAPYGIKVYRYQPGFLHQKVLLVDDDLAAVGTANLDNRSFRLNFELMMLFADASFASEVSRMLETDFANCRLAVPEELAEHGFWFRLMVRVACLFAPIL